MFAMLKMPNAVPLPAQGALAAAWSCICPVVRWHSAAQRDQSGAEQGVGGPLRLLPATSHMLEGMCWAVTPSPSGPRGVDSAYASMHPHTQPTPAHLPAHPSQHKTEALPPPLLNCSIIVKSPAE